MLLGERKTLPRGPGWHFEIRHDGYRLLATTDGAAEVPQKRPGAVPPGRFSRSPHA